MTEIYKGRKYEEDEKGNIISNGRTQLDVDFYLSKHPNTELPTFREVWGWSITSY